MHHITAIYDWISWWVAKKKVLNYHVISRSTNKNNLKLTPCVHKENLENETKVTLGLINLNIFSASVGVFSKVEMKTELETNQPAFNSETLCRSLKGNERKEVQGRGVGRGRNAITNMFSVYFTASKLKTRQRTDRKLSDLSYQTTTALMTMNGYLI